MARDTEGSEKEKRKRERGAEVKEEKEGEEVVGQKRE